MKDFTLNLIFIFLAKIVLCLCDIPMGTFTDNEYHESHVVVSYDKMSLKMCARTCLYQKSCNAINIDMNTRVCELLTAASGDSVLTQTGSRYMVSVVPCDDVVCHNGGTCKNLVSSFECKCLEGYSGNLCQTDPCQDIVCNNGGTCQPNGPSYVCNCVDGYSGPLCDQSACESMNCGVNGNCQMVGSTAKCICTDGYTGNQCEHMALDCETYKQHGAIDNGVYKIFIDGLLDLEVFVYCDMVTDGGGWTVFQRRYDNSTDFYDQRTWDSYESGFGNLTGEFWLGNEFVHLMTRHDLYMLRVDLEKSAETTNYYAKYTTFRLNDVADNYTLIIAGHSGTAPDANQGMSFNANKQFSSPDRDYTGSFACPTDRKGSWWYYSCANANLNGVWNPGVSGNQNMVWYGLDQWKGLRKSSMKIRKKTV